MTPQQYQRASRLFDDALRREASQRESFIAAADDDTAVLRAVRGMLAQHDAPAFDLDSAALSGHLDLPALAAQPTSHDAHIPARIGPYDIIDILGTGGMSVVYRARQAFPDRMVALKVLRAGALSPAASRRFRAEVQTLAKLSHPNIAQVFDAGSFRSDDAAAPEQPYFAMELIDGLPLTEFAQRHRLAVRQKLRMMIDICRAVQHAHLRGVIHRDLKPGNILVHASHADGHQPILPIPKVLDFGIARATDLDVTRATLVAEAGRIVGTLPYMSPEQLAGDAAAIDLRSDVYALGVVLFELLTNQLPHRLSAEMSLTQTAHAIAGQEPRRIGEVDRSLRGEIEAIVSTAMERDRARRYQSAEALADDLQAYLDHRPIRARSPGPLLRARKWTRRHPAMATAATIALIAGVAIAGLIAQQRAAAVQAANRQLQQALADAGAQVRDYAGDLDSTLVMHQQLADVRNYLYRYNPPDEAARLEEQERRLLGLLGDHEAQFHRTQNLIAQAERLGGPPDEIAALHARLYLARSREAEAAGDRFNRTVYLDLLRQSDPSGRIAGELTQRFSLNLATDPPGAQAYLFRMVEQSDLFADGEPRLVPVPYTHAIGERRPKISGEEPIVPGQFALRVVDGGDALALDDLVLAVGCDEHDPGMPIRDSIFVIAAPGDANLQPFDRLVAIDDQPVHSMFDVIGTLPHTPAPAPPTNVMHAFAFARKTTGDAADSVIALHGPSLDALGVRVGDAAHALGELGGLCAVWHRGQIARVRVPRGLDFRVTAKPLLVGPAALLGSTPLNDIPIERGMYLMFVLAEGCEPLRVPLPVRDDAGMLAMLRNVSLQLLPRGSTPRGYVRSAVWIRSDCEPYWIMEHEVTLGEYLEFLNDPATRATIDASPTPTLYPRSGSLMECGRDPATGLFNAGAELREDYPVLAVNWHDAMAYAKWKTNRAHERGEIGEEYVFDLPTHQQWLAAWGVSDDDQYPWGTQFRPSWCASNYAHAQPAPEAVMQFPIDESNTGAFDFAGSVSEWLNAWWIEERDQREIAGGSWGHGGFNYKDMFMLYGQNGVTSTVTNGTCGFRLVMRKRD